MLKDIFRPAVFFLMAGLFIIPACKPVPEEKKTDAIPVLSISTPQGEEILSKEEWIKGAVLSLNTKSDNGYSFDALPTSIRGRGNSTWLQPKKPYALKLEKKQEILGMPEHKRWVLIANYLDNTFIRNSMAFYISEQLEMDYTVRGEFVMLNLNGRAQGLYWLGEAIKVDKNRVDIDDENDYLIEIDLAYDEVWKFRSRKKGFRYMVKNDDAMTGERLGFLRDRITDLELLLYPEEDAAPDETYQEILDLDSWIKFYLVNELMSNGEIVYPKSTYLTYRVSDGKLKAGPVWDFDFAALSQSDSLLTNTLYYDALFNSPSFKKRLKEIWYEYKGRIDIETQIEHFRGALFKVQQEDTKIWGPHLDPSGISRDSFDAYIDFLKETLCKKFAAVDRMIEEL